MARDKAPAHGRDPRPRPGQRTALLAATALFPVLLAGFLFFSEILYEDVDAALGIALITGTPGSVPLGSQSQISHLQGMGAQSLPVNAWINPGYAIFRLGTTLPFVFGSYLLFAGSLFLAVFILGRALRVGRLQAAVASQLCCLLLFPPLEVSVGFYYQLRLNPGVVHYVAIALILIALLIRLGTRSAAVNGALVLALPMLFLYSTLCDPLWTVAPYLSLCVFFFAALFVNRTRRSTIWRAGGVLFALGVAASLSVPSFLRLLMAYTARAQFRTEIVGEVQDYLYTFLPFQGPRPGAMFLILLGGAALALRGRSRPVRVFAAATLAHMALLTGLSALYLFSDINWTFPLPVYLQQSALPVYILVAFAGWLAAFERVRNRLPPLASRVVRVARRPAAAVCLVPVAALALLAVRVGAEHKTVYALDTDRVSGTTSLNPIVAAFQEELAARPGKAFRGAAVTLGSAGEQPAVNTFLSELWIMGIPTLEEYSQLVSPPFYYLLTRGLGRPEDGYSGRNRVRMTVPRVDLLRAMGVRYILTTSDHDAPLRGAPRARPLIGNGRPGIRCYELASPNAGTYSPVRARTASSAREIVDLLLSPGMDFEREVIVTEPLEGPLVAARDAAISFAAGGVRVTARSDGRSLLLLPLQFSHALRVRPAVGGVRLLRANLAQTALVFDREIDAFISLDFGFRRTDGRARDLADVRSLAITEDGSRSLPPDDRDRQHPHQLFRLPAAWTRGRRVETGGYFFSR